MAWLGLLAFSATAALGQSGGFCTGQLSLLREGIDARIYEVPGHPNELVRVLKQGATRQNAEDQVVRSRRLREALPDNAMEVLGVSEVRLDDGRVVYGVRVRKLTGFLDIAAVESLEPAARKQLFTDLEHIFTTLAANDWIPVDHGFNNVMVEPKTGRAKIIDLTSVLMHDLDTYRVDNQVADYAWISGQGARAGDEALRSTYALELAYGAYRETVETFTRKIPGPPYRLLTYEEFRTRSEPLRPRR